MWSDDESTSRAAASPDPEAPYPRQGRASAPQVPQADAPPSYLEQERPAPRVAPVREPQPRPRTQRSAPAQQPLYERSAPPPPPAPYYEPDYYDEPEDYDRDGGWLRNPYVLAGVAVLGAIILAVLVVVLFGQGGDTPDQGAVGGEPTVQLPVGTGNGNGIIARSIATATVREGPALGYVELGLLRSGQDVRVVGRNDAATWFEIIYPHNSDMRGWVPATALRVEDADLARLAVVDVTPVPRPTVDLPTPIPRPEDPTPEPTETREPQNEPVLAVAISGGCVNGQQLVIVLLNSGTENMQNTPFQLIISNDGVVVYDEMLAATMVAGQTAQYPTGIAARPQSMSVTVSVPDADALPSVATCTVVEQGTGSVPPPLATPTPGN